MPKRLSSTIRRASGPLADLAPEASVLQQRRAAPGHRGRPSAPVGSPTRGNRYRRNTSFPCRLYQFSVPVPDVRGTLSVVRAQPLAARPTAFAGPFSCVSDPHLTTSFPMDSLITGVTSGSSACVSSAKIAGMRYSMAVQTVDQSRSRSTHPAACSELRSRPRCPFAPTARAAE